MLRVASCLFLATVWSTFLLESLYAFAHDTAKNDLSNASGSIESNLDLIANTDIGLARAARLKMAMDATQNKTDYEQAIAIFDREVRGKKYGEPIEWIMAAAAHAQMGNMDQSFEYLYEAIEHGLRLNPKSVENDLTKIGGHERIVADPRFPQFLDQLNRLRETWREELDPARYGVASPRTVMMDRLRSMANSMSPEEFAQQLAQFNDFPQPTQTDRWVRYEHFGLKGTYPYYLYIPPTYDATSPTGLIIYLHGETSNTPPHGKDELRTFLSDNPYREVAKQHNLLLMCPVAHNEVQWWEQAGINALHAELHHVKKIYNVDDNAVWLAGHSKGGTSAFGIAVNAPSAFASFYPMNATPIPSRLGNLQHRPIYSTYSSNDNIFPIERMSALWKAACSENANWLFRTLPGHSHSYHSYIEQELPNLMQHMLSCRRPPLPSRIVWETSSTIMTGCDWLRVERVTPGKNRSNWHDRSSYAITSKLDNESLAGVRNRFGEDVGKIRAFLNGNTFEVETSQIGEFSIKLNPQMIDFRYPVKVIVNGELIRNEQISMDNDVMLTHFERESDRSRIWCNVLRVVVPNGA